MMPILAHNLFEMMQVTIGAVQAFTERCVRGVSANREKAEAWLERNAIIVTALNPLIGYRAGAALVKETLQRGIPLRQVALERAEAGQLRHREQDRDVTPQEIEAALRDVRRLTEGGIIA
jgi:fumarate hydratase class II